jgi:hypothetical protein
MLPPEANWDSYKVPSNFVTYACHLLQTEELTQGSHENGGTFSLDSWQQTRVEDFGVKIWYRTATSKTRQEVTELIKTGLHELGFSCGKWIRPVLLGSCPAAYFGISCAEIYNCNTQYLWMYTILGLNIKKANPYKLKQNITDIWPRKNYVYYSLLYLGNLYPKVVQKCKLRKIRLKRYM